MSPERACNIIVACVVLFNIAKDINDPYLGRQHNLDLVEMPNYDGAANIQGNVARDLLVANAFN